MLTNCIFFLILLAPSVYANARFGKRPEETLPVFLMGMVMFLFLFGLADGLSAGMVVIYFATALLYGLTVLHLLKTWAVKDFLKNLITPGTLFFLVMYGLLTLWNRGKLAGSWDEFSHWVDIVRAVTDIDDFGTNPAANAAFQTYPPAMMLFQYSLQKVYVLLNPGYVFSEWRVYFAFQIFFLAVLLPFFRDITFRQPLKLILNVVIVLLAPLLFYSNLYSAVYIDSFLGILFGAGMAMVLLHSQKDGLYVAYICLICATLTLSKDVGVAFALFLALAFGADWLMDGQRVVSRHSRFLMAPTALLAAWVPKLLWSREIRLSGARVSFSGKIDWNILMDVIRGRDTSYRSALLGTYWDALQTKTITLERLNISVNYVSLTLIFIAALVLLGVLYSRKKPGQGKRHGSVFGISGISLVAYMVGLCVIYMFKFSEYEATRLASMERYLHIAFLGIWLLILLSLGHWVGQSSWCRGMRAALLLVLLLVVPTSAFEKFVRGEYVSQSISIRAPYRPLAEKIAEYCDGDDRIYFISQESSGFDFWVSRFNARPNSFNENFSWSIGMPFYDGDVWTKTTTPEQWQKLLLEQYDYVAIYKLNDYFLENFGPLFADPLRIEENGLYRLNRESGKLEICE